MLSDRGHQVDDHWRGELLCIAGPGQGVRPISSSEVVCRSPTSLLAPFRCNHSDMAHSASCISYLYTGLYAVLTCTWSRPGLDRSHAHHASCLCSHIIEYAPPSPLHPCSSRRSPLLLLMPTPQVPGRHLDVQVRAGLPPRCGPSRAGCARCLAPGACCSGASLPAAAGPVDKLELQLCKDDAVQGVHWVKLGDKPISAETTLVNLTS